MQTSYVAPRSTLAPAVGDIVLYDGRQWDVVAVRAVAPPDEAGYRPLTLRLERIERPKGQKRVIPATADSRDVVILGRQPALMELPPEREVERARDTG